MANDRIILVADSGSTKTVWRVWKGQEAPFSMETSGINPIQMNETELTQAVSEPWMDKPNAYKPEEINEVNFYGAGCLPHCIPTIENVLRNLFPVADLHIESDLLGAARALCGDHEGIACILGTGSNSCLYDGHYICAHTPALGYILGDEGSGAALGKQFLGNLLKGLLPDTIKEAFETHFHLTAEQIIEQVYRRPQANRYLASFTRFIADHRQNDCMHSMLVDSFEAFFRRNIVAYNRPDLPAHLAGSIAHVFRTEITEAAANVGIAVGQIIASPIEGMTAYHMQVHPNENTY
ncbi:MAG: hypothetical protein NC388_04690 [Clostridium sp.]|nr:hypothetical protein [Clostridium sp.]